MKILAIETSHETGSIALLHGAQLLQRQLEGASQHSAQALAAIAALLAEAGLRPGELDAVAFGAGPGAFTGVRLACGIAQGLALGAGLGVAAVGSLDAIASQCTAAQLLIATDARMGEIYCAHFTLDDDGRPHAVDGPHCIRPEELEILPGDWFGAGSGFAVHGETLQARLGAQLCGSDSALYPQADEVARLAVGQVASHSLLAPELVSPLYVRNKVAFTLAERLAKEADRAGQAGARQ